MVALAFSILATVLGVQGAPAASDTPSSPDVPRITSPHWLSSPTAIELASVYPPQAAKHGIGGSVRFRCIVTDEGRLTDCQVLSEAPAGKGFGEAALRLAKFFLMTRTTSDDRPVGGAVVIIPMRFIPPTG